MDGFARIIAVAKDVATIIGACLAGYVALKGLSAWQRQLRGNTQYDLARRLLLSAYKLRSALQAVRAPGMHSMETANALKETGISLEGLDQRDSLRAQKTAAYQVRWRSVQDAKNELHVNGLEAQVLWGKDVQAACQKINGCVQTLWAAIVVSLEFEAQGVREEPAAIIARHNILWSMAAKPEDDRFAVELDGAVQTLETLMEPHLVLA